MGKITRLRLKDGGRKKILPPDDGLEDRELAALLGMERKKSPAVRPGNPVDLPRTKIGNNAGADKGRNR